MVKELTLLSPHTAMVAERQQLHDFLQQFRSVTMLRLDPFNSDVALSLQQGGEFLLPFLNEIEISAPSISQSTEGADEEYQRCVLQATAAFEPFVSARERAGRLVKVIIVPLRTDPE